MVNYSDWNLTDDHSYNVYCALKYCREHGESGIRFPKGHYDFYEEMASEKLLFVANHGISKPCRIAFLLEDMHNFSIDGGGSEFVFHGSIIPIVIANCENVKVRNYSVDYETLLSIETRVVATGNGFADLMPKVEQKWYINGKTLFSDDGYGNAAECRYMTLKGLYGENKYTSVCKDVFGIKDSFEDLKNGMFRVYADADFKENMCVILQTCVRPATGIFIENSKKICIADYEINRSYGMGVLAQKSEDITVDNMTVRAKSGREISLSGDGVHFVNCRGVVKVVNSSFESQFDDALNIHGIFTKITAKGLNYIIVKYMHPDTKGMDLYESGSIIQTLNPDTLIPNGRYTIKKAEIINAQYTKLYLNESTENIRICDVAEDLTKSCDLIFENNRVLNNRARGMLVAAKGKIRIKNNYFNTTGAAILFESDGKKWYESGGTSDVVISENVFDNCLYGNSENWGSAVIDMKPRERFDGEHYYHSKVEIINNKFYDNKKPLLYADNAKEVVFSENVIENQVGKSVIYQNCGKFICSDNKADEKKINL